MVSGRMHSSLGCKIGKRHFVKIKLHFIKNKIKFTFKKIITVNLPSLF